VDRSVHWPQTCLALLSPPDKHCNSLVKRCHASNHLQSPFPQTLVLSSRRRWFNPLWAMFNHCIYFLLPLPLLWTWLTCHSSSSNTY
jgi:hypothetical protein